MLQKLRLFIGSMLAASAATAADVKPPVDLNKPVENPSLVRALERVAKDGSNAAKDELLIELQRANFLAVILTDEMKTTSSAPGQTTIEKGSRIKFLTAGKDGKHFLPLFSDWQAIRAYTDLSVSVVVLPAAQAWEFALQGDTYQGVVINPAHNALPLERPMLLFLSQHAR